MATRDDLRLLSIFHYVLAGLAGLFALFPLVYVGLGVLMLSGKLDGKNPPPAFVGWIVLAVGVVMMLFAVLYVVGLVVAGRALARHRSWTFCVVMAALSCAFAPFGTVLGVFTLIVLTRAETKVLFQQGPAAVT